ncbi:hypothetical protein DRE_03745 [Drechslerella stenobrocha 248]|uniref:Alpha/beta hydrolase fold-3 domain-containing protein n=1 Tax=Drechslerella stenobrocha 248 TaxID=1043628 RepID=W7I486_9PEZI|nr:hypothetical protein DRE_03745 [Drechslerella stenobrocha 248]
MHRVLGPVSWLDCLVFGVFLAVRLLLDPRAGIVRVASWLINAVPYFMVELPLSFIQDHFLLPYKQRPSIVKTSTLFQELVIRLVRYAFTNLPSDIGRVFFAKEVVLPFYRFRLLRHGLRPSNVPSWSPEEIHQNGIRGIWVKTIKDRDPDIALYYIHGGGFTMGSSYFYLEFLASWASKLKEAGFENPCVFALDYTLVPDAKFPTQLYQAYLGYQVLHELAGSAELAIAGDSAGGNIALSLLLHLAKPRNNDILLKLRKPSYATLISPWTVLVSSDNRNTDSDFLDAYQLHLYGVLYADAEDTRDPYKSPGLCEELEWWEAAMPTHGMHIVYGNQEVFTAEIKSFISRIRQVKTANLRVTEKAAAHVWPVVQAFLGVDVRAREEGVQIMANVMSTSLRGGAPSRKSIFAERR